LANPGRRPPTVFIIASDQHRNGKTLFARLLADYLMLDGLDPFLIDTDAPEGPLRARFPGRTQLADFARTQGQIKIFDTILNARGRDYVIDLTAKHTQGFFETVTSLGFFTEARKQGFFITVFFIVDKQGDSLKQARALNEREDISLFVPVRNLFVGSAWPEADWAFTMPVIDDAILTSISRRHFSLREYVLGDMQGLPYAQDVPLKRFIYQVMQGFNDLDSIIRLRTVI
jgi:hypothetical protein